MDKNLHYKSCKKQRKIFFFRHNNEKYFYKHTEIMKFKSNLKSKKKSIYLHCAATKYCGKLHLATKLTSMSMLTAVAPDSNFSSSFRLRSSYLTGFLLNTELQFQSLQTMSTWEACYWNLQQNLLLIKGKQSKTKKKPPNLNL